MGVVQETRALEAVDSKRRARRSGSDGGCPDDDEDGGKAWSVGNGGFIREWMRVGATGWIRKSARILSGIPDNCKKKMSGVPDK